MESLSIGQVAQRAGVGVQTIRFYEKEGLLPEPARRPSGYRQYSGAAVRRLHFIKRAKDLGFSLEEIRELFALRIDPGSTCGAVKRRALAKVADVEAKIASLERIRGALLELADACKGTGPTSDCPILDALEGDGVEDG